MKHTLANGKYNARTKTITLASGHEISAKELIQFKKEGLTNGQIIARLEEREPVVKEAPKPVKQETPKVEWAVISTKEVRSAGFTRDKPEPKTPWYKKLLKGVVK